MELDPGLFDENARTATTAAPTVLPVGALHTESGGFLSSVDVAYMTFGELNAARDNAILVLHALSGNANCAQWWDRLIGPGKTLDTTRYCVVGVNALGGCDGSTGPASLAEDGKPYGSRFPMITVGDMTVVQDRLRQALGIEAWCMVCGGSMGGMQALEYAVRFPDRVERLWATASAASHSAMQIGFNEVARQAIMRDPKWRGGDYDPNDPPVDGLSVARMVGHISFLSEAAFAAKFGRNLQDKAAFEWTFAPEFQVESYLNYQGNKFTKRFDANALLVLMRAIDYYALCDFSKAQCRCLFTSFSSDWLYTPAQSATLHEMALAAGLESTNAVIDLPFGHDSFLLDGVEQTKFVEAFL